MAAAEPTAIAIHGSMRPVEAATPESSRIVSPGSGTPAVSSMTGHEDDEVAVVLEEVEQAVERDGRLVVEIGPHDRRDDRPGRRRRSRTSGGGCALRAARPRRFRSPHHPQVTVACRSMLHALETVRSGMPSARHAVYLNAGTWGPLPTRAADAHARAGRPRRVARPHRLRAATRSSRRSATRRAPRFAESVSSDPERIALTHSTSGGMNLVLGGMAFAPGDEIVTTDNEHPGLLEPLAALERRYGIEVRVAEALHGRRSARRDRGADRPAHEARRALARALGERARAADARDLRRGARRRRPGARRRRAGRGGDRRRSRGARRRRVRRARARNGCAGRTASASCGSRTASRTRSRSPRRATTRATSAARGSRSGRARGATTARRSRPRALAGLAAAVSFRRELVGWSEGAAQMADVRARCVALLVGGARRDAAGRERGRRAARRVHGRRPLGRGRRRGARGRTACWRARCPGLDWVRVSLGYWLSDSDLERLATSLALARVPQMAPGRLHARGHRRQRPRGPPRRPRTASSRRPSSCPSARARPSRRVDPRELEQLGAQIILGNTYHLHFRPGAELIAELGGLHRFMGWDRALLTDSGGFQVFSLADTRRIDADGVTFRSVYDGSVARFTPELAMAVQASLGSDIAMAFDECPPAGATRAELERAVERTARWAERCVAAPRARRPAALRHRAGRRRIASCARARWHSSRRCRSRATRSAG